MSKDVQKLVESLSKVAERFLEQGDHPPVSGATIDAWGHLEMVAPPPLHRYPPKRQIEQLEAGYRRAADEGLCRACAHMLEVNVRDPAGADRIAILVSVETAAGLALDVFVPFSKNHESHGGRVDPTATFANPRPPRVFRLAKKPVVVEAANDSGTPKRNGARVANENWAPLSCPPARQGAPPSWERPRATATPPALREVNQAEVQTRLLAAIVRGDLAEMGRALQQGAQVDEPLLGQTPVEMALRARAKEPLDWLLQHGAALPRLPLAWWRDLSQNGDRELLGVLQRHGVKVPLWYHAVHRLGS